MAEEIYNIDKTIVYRRIIYDDMRDDLGERHFKDLKGGQWLRLAANAIARDMLANQCVKVHDNRSYEHELTYLSYVAKVGTPDRWRILP